MLKMNLRKKLILSSFAWMSLFIGGFMSDTQASPVSTVMITEHVINAALQNPFGNFLNYRVEGLCFWLKKGFFGPYVVTTLKVNEFLPDAVVTVYNGYGQDPWDYANATLDPLQHQLGDAQEKSATGFKTSYGTSSVSLHNDMSEKFKEVDIIGDPALVTFFDRIPYASISSEAVSLQPYYSSLSDAYLWRNPMLDNTLYPQYLLPGSRVVGSLMDPWGKIFPRIGTLNQPGDYKAAAVLALRAADITTQASQSHVYLSLTSGSCGHDCQVWPSHENDFADVKYQEIYPVASTTAQDEFGKIDIGKGLAPYGQDQYTLSQGNYIWVMWRHYEGCIQTDGTFLGST